MNDDFERPEEETVQSLEPEIIDDRVYGYDETLHYSQHIRRRIVNEKMRNGPPKEKDDVDIVLKALKDMDSTAINDRRNNIEEKNGDNARTVVDAIQQYMKGVNSSPFARLPDGSARASLPSFDESRAGDVSTVPGEMVDGIISETSEEFMHRVAPDKDESE